VRPVLSEAEASHSCAGSTLFSFNCILQFTPIATVVNKQAAIRTNLIF
jgi:hypothetical protein